MDTHAQAERNAVILSLNSLDKLIFLLRSDGFRVVAPQKGDHALVLDTVESIGDLPAGWIDDQAPGHYRLVEAERPTLFEHGPTADSCKKVLNPPEDLMWRARRRDMSFVIEDAPEPERTALVGIRSCDLHAIDILDRVYGPDHANDPAYRRRRDAVFIFAVDCVRPGGACFCTSLGTGPRVSGGADADLVMAEIHDDRGHRFLVSAGTSRGGDMLSRLESEPASDADYIAADEAAAACSQAMPKSLIGDVAGVLARNVESLHWDEVAKRCLSCGNCTLACPTCFCAQIEDRMNLSGTVAERTRHWDSCFNLDHSYLYGGSLRLSCGSRYRQWISHKLSTWYDQFGVSGCVGCGRCITWCPVGIDITEEARAIRDDEAEG
jgi:Fe-S-cluster-containing hydrogenase component 2